MSAASCDVVLIHHKRPDMCCSVLWSIVQQTTKPNRILLIENSANEPVCRCVQFQFIIAACADLGIEFSCHVRQDSCMADARELGERLASSRFVLYADDDTLYPPTYLEHGLFALQAKHGHVYGTLVNLVAGDVTRTANYEVSGPYLPNGGTLLIDRAAGEKLYANVRCFTKDIAEDLIALMLLHKEGYRWVRPMLSRRLLMSQPLHLQVRQPARYDGGGQFADSICHGLLGCSLVDFTRNFYASSVGV